jgi:hypothetical protein
MAMQDNTVLPGAADTGGVMSPQVQAFLSLLMGGGLSPFGAFGGQQFGGFGQFLMNNPALMRGLGLAPQGAVPGPLPGSAPVVDSTAPPLGGAPALPLGSDTREGLPPISAPSTANPPGTVFGGTSVSPPAAPGADLAFGGTAQPSTLAPGLAPSATGAFVAPPVLRTG